MPKSVSILAYRFGKGAGQHSAAKAPLGGYRVIVDGLMKLGISNSWHEVVPRIHRMPSPNDQYKDMPHSLKNADAVIEAVTKLAENVALTILKGESFPLTFGGDHTQGLGTFKGMALAETAKAILTDKLPLKTHGLIEKLKSPLRTAIADNDMRQLSHEINLLLTRKYLSKKELENFLGTMHVIWFDAHGDFNTPTTTPSGNAHGMPAAAIAGIGNPKLNEILGEWIRIKPANIHYLAVRDLDNEEERLMKSKGTHIHYMPEISKFGLDQVLKNILTEINKIHGENTKIHLSFDIDGIDAKYVPATGTPVGTGSSRNPNVGPSLAETLKAFTGIADKVMAMDISESNFRIDRDPKGITLETVNLLIQCFFGQEIPTIKYESYEERLVAEFANRNQKRMNSDDNSAEPTALYIPN